MLALYHAPSAVCAAKARVVLAEKAIPYEGHVINLHLGEQFNPEYMKLNPNAVVPTLVHDGYVLIATSNERLDVRFVRAQKYSNGRMIGARLDTHASSHRGALKQGLQCR